MNILNLKKIVYEGYESPVGYGSCYFDYARRAHVCYPIPLNLIFRWVRNIYIFLAKPERNYKEQKAYNIGYKQGREDFYREIGKEILKQRGL